MEDILKFNIYNFFPNIKKIRDNGYSQYDYIAFSFDLEFPYVYENNTVYKKLSFFTYLYVDFYDKELKILFDQIVDNSTGESYFIQKQEHKKSNINKIKFSIDNYDPITLKKTPVNIEYNKENCKNINNFQDLINDFVNQYVQKEIDKIEPFLLQNNIGYTKSELKKYNKMIIDFLLKEFSSVNIDIKYPRKIKEIDSKILYYKLNRTIPISTSIINSKIKKSKI